MSLIPEQTPSELHANYLRAAKFDIDPTQKLGISDDGPGFLTVEGEGPLIGRRSIFLRLAGCNLRCGGFKSADSPHGCDSYISWSKQTRYTFTELAKYYEETLATSSKTYKDLLIAGDVILKITGGEPMLQQEKVFNFIAYLEVRWCDDLRENDTTLLIDFETNATMIPGALTNNRYLAVDGLRSRITYTTSPKLEFNGDPLVKRYNGQALQWHKSNGSAFKFVVRSAQDIKEIEEHYVDKYKIPRENVWLMPCAGSRDEHIKVGADVAELAKEHGYHFSPRLHLLLWDMALKV